MQIGPASEDRTSVSGNIITVGGALVSWKSSKQKCIALSSTEAEYVSLSRSFKRSSMATKSAVIRWIQARQSDNSIPRQYWEYKLGLDRGTFEVKDRHIDISLTLRSRPMFTKDN